MASFAFQGPRAGLPGHPQHAVGVSVPVGLALFSFLTQTGVLAGTHPPNRALFGDGSAPALGAFQAMMGRAHRWVAGVDHEDINQAGAICQVWRDKNHRWSSSIARTTRSDPIPARGEGRSDSSPSVCGTPFAGGGE
jgi:hypothetical protein